MNGKERKEGGWKQRNKDPWRVDQRLRVICYSFSKKYVCNLLGAFITLTDRHFSFPFFFFSLALVRWSFNSSICLTGCRKSGRRECFRLGHNLLSQLCEDSQLWRSCYGVKRRKLWVESWDVEAHLHAASLESCCLFPFKGVACSSLNRKL